MPSCDPRARSQDDTRHSEETENRIFASYGRQDQSPVLLWLPILLALLASLLAALLLCPVPRSQSVSLSKALWLSIASAAGTVALGVLVLAIGARLAGLRGRGGAVRQALPLFCVVGAWITPVVAFYRRDSWWAASIAVVLAVLASRLVYRHHLAAGEPDIALDGNEAPLAPSAPLRGLLAPVGIALLLQFAALSALVSRPRAVVILIGSAAFVISLFRHAATPTGHSDLRSQSPLRLLTTAGLGVLFVAASLTPYLAVPGASAGLVATGAGAQHAKPRSPKKSRMAKSDLLQSVRSFFQRLLAKNPPPGEPGTAGGPLSGLHPYLLLQSLFGDAETGDAAHAPGLEKKSNNRKSAVIVVGDSYPGIILRPETREYVALVPPLVTRTVFGGPPAAHKSDPLSIPFYGAYWLFRASDKTLPANALDSRGDPATTSFKTTDFSPISMEAHQNFGSLIEMSCCRAIEVVIANGERRPGTVEMELILRNTRLPGRPFQSLGTRPVNSTLHWFPGDNRPAVVEVLTYRLPAQPAIRHFDEAILRFDLKSPRRQWSAKISIEKFRLLPRGL